MTAQPLSPTKIYSQAELDALGDEALVEFVRGRNELAVRTLTRRYNRRLFRIARSVLRNDAEAEDVVQESWVRAFAGLNGFRGESAFATWLTRIAINEALGRKRRLRPTVDWETYSENKREAEVIQFPASAMTGDPERTMARSEILGRKPERCISRELAAADDGGFPLGQLLEPLDNAVGHAFAKCAVERKSFGQRGPELPVECVAQEIARAVQPRLHRLRLQFEQLCRLLHRHAY